MSDASSLELTRENYDRLAPWYDAIAGRFEWPQVRRGLDALAAQPGERILEVGHGTGRALVELARAVGPSGRVIGADLSPRMAEQARRRLSASSLDAELITGDALRLQLAPGSLDAVFSAFTVEVLPAESQRALLTLLQTALKPGGRIVLVSMAAGDRGAMSSLYAWSHRRFPRLVDCAPIDAGALLGAAGFASVRAELARLAGIAVAVTRGEVP